MSGKELAATVIGCLVFSCLIFLIPPLKMAFIVEAKLVIGLWWLTWIVIIAKILYMGRRIEDDLSSNVEVDASKKSYLWEVLNLAWYGEGLAGIIAGFVLSIIFALFSFLILELLLPLFAWLAYNLVLKMLRTAAHDRHNCEKNLLLSTLYATFWSTLYVMPLFLCVYIVQYLTGDSTASH